MRLEPIDKPTGLMMRIAFWMTRRQLGRVITPMKVLYPRIPGAMKLSYEIQKFEMKGIRLERGRLEIGSDGLCAIAERLTAA